MNRMANLMNVPTSILPNYYIIDNVLTSKFSHMYDISNLYVFVDQIS